MPRVVSFLTSVHKAIQKVEPELVSSASVYVWMEYNVCVGHDISVRLHSKSEPELVSSASVLYVWVEYNVVCLGHDISVRLHSKSEQ